MPKQPKQTALDLREHKEEEPPLYRDASVTVTREQGEDDKETRALSISVSSEKPVERFDWMENERYLEVLDHDHVDLSEARDGLPFLVEHWGAQVGLVRKLKVGADDKLRGEPIFGNHPDAEWVRADMEEGIRTKVSVGYRLGELLNTERKEGKLPVRRYAWTPLEVSSVAIPADNTVGVGRSQGAPPLHEGPDGGEREITVETKDTVAPDGNGATNVTPVVRQIDATELEQAQQRTADLAAIAKENGMESHLPGWLSGGKTIRQIQDEIIESLRQTSAKTAPPGHVDLTEREHREYSITRGMRGAMAGDWKDAGLEREVSDTCANAMDKPKDDNALYVPMNSRVAIIGNVAGTDSIGGHGVQTSVLSLIDLLRNKMLVRQLGATVLTGLQGDIKFPRQLAANSFTWEGENPSTAKVNTAATLDSITLSPETGMGSTAYSRQLLAQSSFDVDQFIMNDLAQITALGVDLAAINGSGSGEPAGILVDASVTTVALGTDGLVPTFGTMIDLETNQATNNADFGRLVYLTTPGVRGLMKQTEKATNTAQFIWEGGPASGQSMNGYEAHVTNQVPSNLTKGTSTTVCHGVIFGNFAELLIGEWGGAMEIVVDPYTRKTQGMIEITTLTMVDVGIRHGPSFTVNKDALLS